MNEDAQECNKKAIKKDDSWEPDKSQIATIEETLQKRRIKE